MLETDSIACKLFFGDCRADVSAAVSTNECYQTSSQDLEDCSKPSGLWTLATTYSVPNNNRAQNEEHLCTGILHLYNMKHVVLEDTQFSNNQCSSVHAFNSNIYCRGHVNNKDLVVGLLTLTVLTLITVPLHMTNNSVLQNGGGIAVREDVVIRSLAFFSLCRKEVCMQK